MNTSSSQLLCEALGGNQATHPTHFGFSVAEITRGDIWSFILTKLTHKSSLLWVVITFKREEISNQKDIVLKASFVKRQRWLLNLNTAQRCNIQSRNSLTLIFIKIPSSFGSHFIILPFFQFCAIRPIEAWRGCEAWLPEARVIRGRHQPPDPNVYRHFLWLHSSALHKTTL